jgi:uncharacterized protein (UPF0264 family)
MNTTRSRLLPGLLVSVRSVAEAQEAVAGGAAIIDVKEPSHGPLGRADADVTAAIGEAVAGRAQVTVACGELVVGEREIAAHVEVIATQLVAAGLPLPEAVKVGPSRLSLDHWRSAYERLSAIMPEPIELVAVAYADWQFANAPDPARLIDAAADGGASTILIDTFDKSAGGLLDVAGLGRLRDWVAAARSRGLGVALAGRLTANDLPPVTAIGAQIVGVRSAACEGGRMGRVDRGNVIALVGTLAEVGAVVSGSPPPPRICPEELRP